MQFILVKNSNGFKQKDKTNIKKCFNETTTILSKHIEYEWLSSDNTCYFIGRNPDLEIYTKYDVFNIDDENNLSCINGWLKFEDKDELLGASLSNSKLDFNNIDGYFNLINVNSKGDGEFNSSNLCPSLFYAKKDNVFAISNRISTLSKVFSFDEINKKHIALQIQYQNSSLTNETMYENIYQVPFGTKIIFSSDIKFVQCFDYFYDESLQKAYDLDKIKYWDDCYNKLQSQLKAFANLNLKNNFILGITGGKDSRLLLSLYHEYIESTFTSGPVFSPEVIIGRMVSNVLDIKHTVINNTSNNTSNLLNQLPQHLFSREFIMCPWDFGVIPKNISNNIKIDGQEFVKVKPFKKKDCSIDEIVNDYNKLYNNYVISDEFNELIFEDNLKFMKVYLNNMENIYKFPIIKRQLERGKWVAKVEETIFDHSFTIYPLITNIALKYAYNIPFDSLINEEFHFELIKRSSEELLEIPFFKTSFNLNEIPSLELKIPSKLNYKNVYLVKYFDYLLNFIKDNFDLISDVVKYDFINSLSKEKIFNNSKLSQIMYNILQYIVLLKADDFSDLKNDLSFDWRINEEEIIDDYEENCLNAFIQYNQDIVNLKKEKKLLAEENNVLNESLNNKVDNNKSVTQNRFKSFFNLNFNQFSKYIQCSNNLNFEVMDNKLKINSFGINSYFQLEPINIRCENITVNILFNANKEGIFRLSYLKNNKEIFISSDYSKGDNQLNFNLDKCDSIILLKAYPMEQNSEIVFIKFEIMGDGCLNG